MIKKLFSILIIFLTVSFLGGCSNSHQPANLTQSNQQKECASLNTKCISWGVGKQVTDKNCPLSCIESQKKYSQYNAFFYNPPKDQNRKTIFLTFDCGYENGNTEKILDVLKAENIQAVFFLTGDYLSSSAATIQRMVDENQILGNHSQNHPSMPGITVSKMKDEIETLHNAVLQKFGVQMNMFRPPKGEFSEQSLATTKDLGYSSIFWSFAYTDWNPQKQPDESGALESLKSHLHTGAIYLLHAVSKTNANILSDFINYAKSQGYEFTTILES